MSIVLVTFPGAPKPCDEAIAKEAELESFLERRITGKLSPLKHGSVMLNSLTARSQDST